MKTITFNKDGGPLTVEVTSGFAQPGSYHLQLWNMNPSQVVMMQRGDFTSDDTFTLPSPTASNDGRVLQAFVLLTILKHKKYLVSLKISQDGQEVGTVDEPESGPGTTNSTSLFFNLVATLKAA